MTYTENDYQRLSSAIREVCDVVDIALDAVIANTAVDHSTYRAVLKLRELIKEIRNDSKTLCKVFGFADIYVKHLVRISKQEPFELILKNDVITTSVYMAYSPQGWHIEKILWLSDLFYTPTTYVPEIKKDVSNNPIYSFAYSHTTAIQNFNECVPPNAPLVINGISVEGHLDFLLYATIHKIESFEIMFSNGNIQGYLKNGKMECVSETSIGGSIGKVVCETIDTLQHLRNFKLYLKNHEVNNV